MLLVKHARQNDEHRMSHRHHGSLLASPRRHCNEISAGTVSISDEFEIEAPREATAAFTPRSSPSARPPSASSQSPSRFLRDAFQEALTRRSMIARCVLLRMDWTAGWE